MRRARTRSNPYEMIRGGIFLNRSILTALITGRCILWPGAAENKPFISVLRAAMKMSNIDHCFDNMFTNPKDPQGVSHLTLEARCVWSFRCWSWKPGLECRSLWRRSTWASSSTLATCARDLEAFLSTSCGRGVGTPRASAWPWRDLVTSSWKTFSLPPASCSSPTTVDTTSALTWESIALTDGWPSRVCRWGRSRRGRRHHPAGEHDCLPEFCLGEHGEERAALPHGRWGESTVVCYSSCRQTVYDVAPRMRWCGWSCVILSRRVSQWKARRTSRRSWANNCCSASSSQPSRHSGQVWPLCINNMCKSETFPNWVIQVTRWQKK